MDTVHNFVGALVVLTFLADLGAHTLLFQGRTVPWLRGVSMAASGLLLVQYVLGFLLLAEDHEQVASHYVFAFLPLLTVGLEHGYARTRPTAREQGLWGMVATGGSFVLVLVAFIIGTTNA